MKTCVRIATLVLSLLMPVATRAQGTFAINTGDRVVFYGNSITDQRLYTLYVETYIVTRFPHLDASFVHSGWGGDRVTGGGGGSIDTRIQRDVIAYRPTAMTIMLGMNDGGYRPFDQELYDRYTRGYQHIVETVQKAFPQIRLTLIQPSPYDDVTRPPTFEGGYNAVLIRYGEWVKNYAQQVGATAVDLNSPVVAVLQSANAADPQLAQKIVGDRIHPGAAGHLIMAEAILKAWGAPATVASVEIRAANKLSAKATHARLENLVSGSNGLSWTETDAALPMPFNPNDPVTALVMRSSDFIQSLDQEPLRVTGLKGEHYSLKIDGELVGTFTPAQLSQGINLAEFSTPMFKQAMAVEALGEKHNLVHFTRWRDVQVPFASLSSAHFQPALDALDAMEKDFVAQQRAAAQPKPHQYELIPQ